MRPSHSERGSALIIAVIVVLVMSVLAVGVIRFASREVAGATAGRKLAAASSCAEAARAWILANWNALDNVAPADKPPMDVTLENVTPTALRGGHYGQTGVTQVQIVKLNPQTVGPANKTNDLTNRIGDTVTPYRVVVHCVQGSGTDAREMELEFGLTFGL
jgi:Tfp pilus assembly protein PilX